jgi:hypothetical protein
MRTAKGNVESKMSVVFPHPPDKDIVGELISYAQFVDICASTMSTITEFANIIIRWFYH